MENLEQQFAFVYKKDDTIKVLSLQDAKIYSEHLISDGYSHISTINPLVTLEYLHNVEKSESLIEMFNNVSQHK